MSYHIVCFGNELHGDDGFGVQVYNELRQLTWPEQVSIFNAGIAGLNSLKFLEYCRQAILVDALSNFGNIGDICVLKPEELAIKTQQTIGHDLGIPYLLAALKIIREPLPEMLIIGVEIAAVQPFCLGLSDKTEQAVPKTVRLIRNLLSP